MIKKLRRRLIGASMLSLFTVLLVIMGTVNLLNYRSVLSQADMLLELLAENGGSFPKEEPRPFPEFDQPDSPPEAPAYPTGRREQRRLSPEAPFETRYFTVVLDDHGAAVSSEMGRIAAVDEAAAISLAQKAWGTGREQGTLGRYRYQVQAFETGCRVIFLDIGRGMETFRLFLGVSVGVSALGIAAVFLLLMVLSHKIIAPVSESYEKQKRFITDAGHELKTPLTIIDADAQVLQMDLGENQWVEDIQAQVKRLSGLTGDLILLSRMEEGQNRLAMIDFPLSDLIEETARSFEAIAKTREKRFSCHIHPLLSLKGDEKAVQQLVSILLDNALKYSPAGGSIFLGLERQGRFARLVVENTVAGALEKEQLRRLFDRFYRGDQSRSSQGYGIGLSVAKAITEAHRGKISVHVPEKDKLRITVLLPF